MEVQKIEMTPSQIRWINNKAPELLVEGSAGSGKTIFACFKVIFYCMEHTDASVYVYRVTLPSLKKTSWKEIRNILHNYNIPHEENKSEGVITFTETNSKIYFGALDELSKVRSINADVIYIEQAEELTSKEFYVELMLRLGRGEASKRPDGYAQMILVVQPESEEHWIYKHFKEYEGVGAIYDEETGALIKTYEEALEDAKKERISAHFHYSENYKLPLRNRQYYDNLKNEDYELWLRYSAGKWGKLTDVIYPNYDTVVVRDTFDFYTIGLDFGYNNPACCLLIAWRDDEAYILDEVYESKLLNREFIKKCDEMLFRHRLLPSMLYAGFADKANPDDIEEFCQHDYPVEGGVKDVKAKISTTKQTKLHIHPKCVNTIKEIKSYKYKKNKDRVTSDEPVKINDHAMDALAYCVYGIRGNLSPARRNAVSNFNRIKVW